MMDAIGALLPPTGVGLLFWFVIRSVMRADRSERAGLAAAELEARSRAQHGPTGGPAPSDIPDK